MRTIAQVASWLILVGLALAPILFFAGRLSLERTKLWMLIATIAWFAVTPLWMGRRAQS